MWRLALVFSLLLSASASADCLKKSGSCPPVSELLHISSAAIDTDGECLRLISGNTVSLPCTDVKTKFYADRDLVITRTAAVVRVISATVYQCTFDMMVDESASTLDVAMAFANDAAVGTIISQAQPNILISAGQAIGYRGDSAGACDNGANPAFDVRVFGYYTTQ